MSKENGRVAVITGASRGIGAACARRLAHDGFSVVVNTSPNSRAVDAGARLVEEIRKEGGTAITISADVSDAESVSQLFERSEREFGPAHALVLNAATRNRGEWVDTSENEWDRICGVNLKGAFLCARRAFAENKVTDGAIVTLGSVQSEFGAVGVLAYSTTKAGIIGFTRSLARELGPRSIRVNCVMPGAIQTEEEIESFPDQANVLAEVLAVQALQRRGIPDDIAAAVSFLVGTESSFITGQVLCVDGGWVMR